MNNRALLVALVLSVVVAVGCSEKKKPPSIITYQLSTSDEHLANLEVVVGGKHASNTFQPVAAEYQVLVSLPPETPSVLSSINLELTTPCGIKTIALRPRESGAEEAEGRKSGMVYLHVTATSPIPSSVEVWVDAPGSVTFGSMTLQKGKNQVYDVDCKADLEVRSGQTSLGVVPKVGDTKTEALFVTTESKCYAWNGVKYGGDESGGWHDVLSGKHIYPLEHSIDYFLEAAPSTVSKSGTASDATYRMELIPTACP